MKTKVSDVAVVIGLIFIVLAICYLVAQELDRPEARIDYLTSRCLEVRTPDGSGDCLDYQNNPDNFRVVPVHRDLSVVSDKYDSRLQMLVREEDQNDD